MSGSCTRVLQDVKRRLRQSVEWPLKHSASFERLGLAPPRGVLLHGPPGCSKTSLARAVATSSGANMIPLQADRLYSMCAIVLYSMCVIVVKIPTLSRRTKLSELVDTEKFGSLVSCCSRVANFPGRARCIQRMSSQHSTCVLTPSLNCAPEVIHICCDTMLHCRYLGEGEAMLRQVFQQGRLAAPSIIFLDEIDALFAKRGGERESGTTSMQLLSTLLTEMDGLELATGLVLA